MEPRTLSKNAIKKKYKVKESDERWLLSYADLMTLLFGFFVLLYTLSLEESHVFDNMVKGLAIESSNIKKQNLIQAQNSIEQKDLEIKQYKRAAFLNEKEISSLKTELQELKVKSFKDIKQDYMLMHSEIDEHLESIQILEQKLSDLKAQVKSFFKDSAKTKKNTALKSTKDGQLLLIERVN